MPELATFLDYKPQTLTYIAYRLDESKKYSEFEIPKRSGGSRIIQAPDRSLKILQEKIAKVLNDCYEELLHSEKRRIIPAHGYRKNCSIATNAQLHKNRRHVLNIDLSNYFGSINFGRIRGFFISNNGLGLDEKVATVLAHICCFKNSLPQGAPTSPIISNLITYPLDKHLQKFCKPLRLRYTRYADDITFSTKEVQLPEKLIHIKDGKPQLNDKLKNLFQNHGFKINQNKTRIYTNKQRQEVTGLVVNKTVNLKREARKELRAMVHNYLCNRKITVKNQNETKLLEGKKALNFLSGKLSYATWIATFGATNSFLENHRRFLIRKIFFENPKPLIMTEGPSDVIYLKEAFKTWPDEFTNLCDKTNNGKTTLKVEFYNFRNKRTNEILSLGGTANLTKLIDEILNSTRTYGRPVINKKIIIVVDNDNEGNKVKNHYKEKVNKKSTYFPEFANHLKVVTLKSNCDNKKVIEDFLPKELEEKSNLNEKKLAKNNDFDKKDFISKKSFAEKVFFPNRKEFPLSELRPTLADLNSLLNEND